MRREFACVLFALLVASYIGAQEPAPPTPSAAPTTPKQADGATPSPDTIPAPYKIGGSVSAPVVVHSVEAEFSDEARRAGYQGVCLISLIVDADGNPQNVRVARALGMGLDEKAIEAIRQYKFKPAMKDGTTPVPVKIMIEVDFRLYNGRKPDRSAPVLSALPGSESALGHVKPPVLLNYVEPEYSDFARKLRISGDCVIGLTVDANGTTQNVHVVTSLEPSLDESAVAAVREWYYKPATKDGHAVPFEGLAKVKFRLHGKQP